MKHLLFLLLAGVLVLHEIAGQSRALIDFDAENMHSLQLGDSTVLVLVGEVAFHHNGAIITCDSAVRFNDRYMEFYRNVIINKDSTYIYGDWAEFNGLTNIAKVYAPLVKLVDQDVTMYSYDLEFNTLTNIGRYTQGGTTSQQDNLMESIGATYYADDREVFFSKEVVMQNDEYLLETDSLGYNFDTEISTFYLPTNIWNTDGDFLRADRGSYNHQSDVYIFKGNSYILTEEQELWADSMVYMKTQEIIYLYDDIQINEEEHNTMLFGDYGVYWSYDEHAILTKNPSVISFEDDPDADSVYMRADSIFFYTVPTFPPTLTEAQREEMESSLRFEYPDFDLLIDSLGNFISPWDIDEESGLAADSLLSLSPQPMPEGEEPGTEDLPGPDPVTLPDEGSAGEEPPLTPAEPAEEVAPEKTKRELKKERRERKQTAKAERKAPAQDDTVIREGDPRRSSGMIGEISLPDSLAAAGIDVNGDSLLRTDSLDLYLMDSLGIPVDNLLLTDSLWVQEPELDSVQRIIRAYRDVRIFREDVQAVCDSLVSFSIDSTVHMYQNPVMWSDNNQLKSDKMIFFSKDEQLEHAEFEGQPIMIEHVKDSLFNQVAGKIMYAYFRENEIRQLNVNGNAQTYYYMQESGTDDIGGFLVIESANISFYFDSSRVETITYRVEPVWTMYPMDKIPGSQSQYLDMFEWLPHKRPMSKYDVFDRIIRATRREETVAIAIPDFPITLRIDEDRVKFTEQGIWRDRNDLPHVTPAFFAIPPEGF